jgi:hypothetical protein
LVGGASRNTCGALGGGALLLLAAPKIFDFVHPTAFA